uniref:COP9 signalosome complex subunit 9 n=1 Tax=Gasterosteus aculeatus aculeatus TaxID=481459 RepID=A0AAQ4PIB0_GASAC
MKPAVDEMFPEGAGPYVDLDEAGGSSGLLMDLAANEKAVHSDFFNGQTQFSLLIPPIFSF